MSFLDLVPTVLKTISGSSVAPKISKNVILANRSGMLEKEVLKLADINTAGYNFITTAGLSRFGMTIGAPFLTYTIINFLTKDETDNTETATQKRNNAMVAGIVSAFVIFFGIHIFRRERTLLKFTGEGMAMQYVKFGLIPLVIGTVTIKIISTFDVTKSALFSAFVAGTILLIARKFFFGYKLNQLEKEVFSQIESLLKKCGNSSSCNHKHSGFLDFFNKNMDFTLAKIKGQTKLQLTPLEVVKFLIEKQSLDSAKGIFKSFTS